MRIHSHTDVGPKKTFFCDLINYCSSQHKEYEQGKQTRPGLLIIGYIQSSRSRSSDFAMKFLLTKYRETQADFFGKRGIS